MSKIDEIKQALAAATPGPWEVVNLGDIHIAKDYRQKGGKHTAQWIAEMYVEDELWEEQAGENAHLIAKAPEYIAYLLEDNDQLRKKYEEKNSRHTKAIRLLMHVTDILSMGRTPDRAGAALKEIYKWLHENNPVGQEGEGNQ